MEPNYIKPDGSLSPSAQYLLAALEDPMTAIEIAKKLNIPLAMARSSLRELIEMRLVKCAGEKYQLDALGVKKLLELSSAVL